MECPNCGQQMVSGRVTLRSQYLARVIFSPDDVTDGFRQMAPSRDHLRQAAQAR